MALSFFKETNGRKWKYSKYALRMFSLQKECHFQAINSSFLQPITKQENYEQSKFFPQLEPASCVQLKRSHLH